MPPNAERTFDWIIANGLFKYKTTICAYISANGRFDFKTTIRANVRSTFGGTPLSVFDLYLGLCLGFWLGQGCHQMRNVHLHELAQMFVLKLKLPFAQIRANVRSAFSSNFYQILW